MVSVTISLLKNQTIDALIQQSVLMPRLPQLAGRTVCLKRPTHDVGSAPRWHSRGPLHSEFPNRRSFELGVGIERPQGARCRADQLDYFRCFARHWTRRLCSAFPQAAHQFCVVRFKRHVLNQVTKKDKDLLKQELDKLFPIQEKGLTPLKAFEDLCTFA